jgi:probable H4MPT-linked C1 transfer pathway protein
VAFVGQEACPLWLGLDRLELALDRLLAAAGEPVTQHAITMTGELTDHFENREAGVLALTNAMQRRLGSGSVLVFAGLEGFIPAEKLQPADALKVASANWLASGLWLATQMHEALFVDMGSTTTDFLPIAGQRVIHRGYTDSERMGYDELLYTGVARTPAMMLANRVPLAGVWAGVMAEHFATAADVYRLTGELPEHADQMPAADQGPKTVEGSQQRLARQFARDAENLPPRHWQQLAWYLRERQLMALRQAAEIHASSNVLSDTAPIVGAGVGRFLVRVLAERMQRDYLDFGDLFPPTLVAGDFVLADCAPAAAVAGLALRVSGGK